MPGIKKENLPESLKKDYKNVKNLREMDIIDGVGDFVIDNIAHGEYSKGGRLYGYEPVEYVDTGRERITMSIPSFNLMRLKMIANQKEIPYQTYLNSIIKEHIDKEVHF